MIFPICLLLSIVLQGMGYYVAARKADTRYRWWTFWIVLPAYYLLLWIGYLREAAFYDGRQQRCGMWVIGYFVWGVAGLLIPLAQGVFTLKDLVYRRLRQRPSGEAGTR